MPSLDIVFGAERPHHILSKNQGPTVGGRPGLEVNLVMRDIAKPGTPKVPQQHYTVLVGGF